MKIFEYLGVAAVAALVTFLAIKMFDEPPQPPPSKWVGEITKTSKHIAVEVPIGYSKLHWDNDGAGKGGIMFQSEFTLMYGVKFPDDWKFDTKKNADGSVDITLPPLGVMNEIKVEFKDIADEDICNHASGDRLARMYKDMTAETKSEYIEKANKYLTKSKNLYDLARGSMEAYYMKFLSSANPSNPPLAVNIKFKGEPAFPE